MTNPEDKDYDIDDHAESLERQIGEHAFRVLEGDEHAAHQLEEAQIALDSLHRVGDDIDVEEDNR